MPRRDGTGPMGEGKMTGRGLGPCNSNLTESDKPFYGRGFARGCGKSRGCGKRGVGFGPGNGLGRGGRTD